MIPLPDKKYSIIYADPPWSYQNRGTRAAASKHYDTMTIEDIKRMGVGAAGGIANEDCVLFMWATFPMLREALDVIERGASADDVQLRTSEHRSMYSYVRLSIDRCTATYV